MSRNWNKILHQNTGKYTYGLQHLTINQWGEDTTIRIGSFCSFGKGTTIYLGGNHRADWVTTFPFGCRHTDIFNTFPHETWLAPAKDVNIGSDVWVANNVTIKCGVNVGHGAILATNSYVVKDVPPYAIVGGNPGKIIKYRFSPEQIEALLKIKWWEWDDKKINENIPLMCNDNIQPFIDKHVIFM